MVIGTLQVTESKITGRSGISGKSPHMRAGRRRETAGMVEHPQREPLRQLQTGGPARMTTGGVLGMATTGGGQKILTTGARQLQIRATRATGKAVAEVEVPQATLGMARVATRGGPKGEIQRHQ
mmetsp:Transcript_145817/g.265617  ORF Transcript_145817/g.265617 Transcript_145817/m.265617 type:complete len:124 (+) Transcript_145817:2761-3132(+)